MNEAAPPGEVRRKDARKKELNAFLRAAFQQVPYGLDSLWRWTEFRTNRIGRVVFESPHDFQLRPAWKCSAFFLFAFFAWFAILGPTPDAFCSLAGFKFANQVRVVGAVVLVVIGWKLGRRILDWATFHLARQAVDQVVAKGNAANVTDGPRAEPAKAPGSSGLARKLDAFIRLTARRREKQRLENIDTFFKSVRNIPPKDRPPLYITFIIFVLGTLLAVAPLGAAALALLNTVADPLACARMEHPLPVVAQFIVLAIVWTGGFFIWRKFGAARSLAAFLCSTLLLGAGILLLWMFFTPHAPRMYSEAQGGFYPHVYLIFAGALMAIALLARPLARKLLSRTEGIEVFRAGLRTRDLLAFRRDLPDVGGIRLLSAFVNGITTHLLHFLLLPAFVVFISPANLVWPLLWPFLFVSGVLLVYGSLSSRWAQMLVHVQRWFLVGTPLVLSILVILLAALRLKDVQYVSTVLDATPMGVLFVIVVMIYVAFWLFEFWINRWAAEQLLGLLGDDASLREGFVRCPYEPPAGEPRPKDSGVVTGAVPGRYIALHGTGRFVAQGWFARKPTGPQQAARDDAFATFGLVELFDVLGSTKEGGAEVAKEVHRRVHLYFTFINMALLAAAIGLWFWHKNWTRPLVVHPMVNAATIKPELVSDAALRAKAIREGDGLAKRLQLQGREGRPSIVVAASGGGTRAAVYTAVALEGMAQIDRARDVVMLSGVSGGGVSAAVFASRFDALRNADPRKESKDPDHPGPWVQYVNAVSQPYIQDVLEGVGELRIAGSWSLGSLLQESLERRAFAPQMTGIDTFGKLNDPALILNSAISGHPYGDSEVLKGRVAAPAAGADCSEQARPYANLAGGRLIFTNLGNLTGFPERSTEVPDLWLPYRIVTDGSVKLSAASALTANFPPVFSNARVRLTSSEQGVCAQSYFVTDGGATENLGLVSALYALRGTLSQMEAAAALGDIHVLALEASAIDYDYHDDRGVGAATGGSKERINSGLTQSLLREVETLVAAHGAKLRVHYLPLPVAFRSRGGFGTHWMFARNISVVNPLLAEAPGTWESLLPEGGKDKVSLDRAEVMVILRALFDPTDPICSRAERVQAEPKSAAAEWSASVQKVTRWICGHDDRRNTPALVPDYQVEAWAKVVGDLATPQESAEFKQYSR